MYFYNKIKENYQNKNVIMFIDMDGVITDYDVGNPLDFPNKRPIYTNIKTFEKINTLDNVEIRILSICKFDYQIKEKNDWIDKYIPFIKKEHRIVLSKETYPGITSPELKCNYLKEFVESNKDKKVIMVDDDNEILRNLMKNIKELDIYQDSSIVD